MSASLRSEPMPVGICPRASPSDGMGVLPARDESVRSFAGAPEREMDAPRRAPALRVRQKATMRLSVLPTCCGTAVPVVRGRDSMRLLVLVRSPK